MFTITIRKRIVEDKPDTILTQQQSIIRYLQHSKGGLTTYEAFEKLNITKLPTRVSELKDKGYEFIQVWETNDDGTKRWYRYFLKSTPKGANNEKTNRDCEKKRGLFYRIYRRGQNNPQ